MAGWSPVRSAGFGMGGQAIDNGEILSVGQRAGKEILLEEWLEGSTNIFCKKNIYAGSVQVQPEE